MAEFQLIEGRERIMAGPASIHIATPPATAGQAREAMAACWGWLRSVESCLTRFDSASELSRLNAAAGIWFAASETLFAATAAALDAARATDGLFDPTLLAHMRAIGYDRDYAELTQDAAGGNDVASSPGIPLPTGGWRDIELDPEGRRIRLPGGVGLDLGGIAKGWAADRAVEDFFAEFPGVIVSLGGDLRLRGGPQPGELWAVGVRDPLRPGANGLEMLRATITLNAGGVATSGATDRWWRQAGAVRHHLIDPRTGGPADLWLAADAVDAATRAATATALAPTAAAAEVAAKVALLAPPLPDASAATLVIMGDGTLHLSEHFNDYLAQHGGGRLWRLS